MSTLIWQHSMYNTGVQDYDKGVRISTGSNGYEGMSLQVQLDMPLATSWVFKELVVLSTSQGKTYI